MNLNTLYIIIQQTLIITTFVIGMMMVVEFINVRTGGLWSEKLQKSSWIQIIFAIIMGIIPGCLGTYTIVSLYIHRVVNFPALLAALIATTGDEAFFMFSLFPEKALIINIILVAISIIVAFALQITMKNKFIGFNKELSFPIHENESCCHSHNHHNHHSVRHNIKNISFVRALLITLCIGVLFLIFSGIVDGSHHLNLLMGGQTEENVIINHSPTEICCDDTSFEHHHHENNIHHHHHHDHGGEADWIRFILIILFIAILIIVVIAEEHFLEEHLWEHVIKVHLPKIFLWTFGVILCLTIINNYVNINDIIDSKPLIILLAAIILGLIPQSGPHLIFILLYAQGSLPFSILLANSIVQDGHGALPLLAESRKAFFVSKGIKIAIALIVGTIGII